jgi:hypothetical protein
MGTRWLRLRIPERDTTAEIAAELGVPSACAD